MGALREPKLLKFEGRTPQITGLYSKGATTSLSNLCYNCNGFKLYLSIKFQKISGLICPEHYDKFRPPFS